MSETDPQVTTPAEGKAPEPAPQAPPPAPAISAAPPPQPVPPKTTTRKQADHAAAAARQAKTEAEREAESAAAWQEKAETLMSRMEATEHRALLSEVASDLQLTKSERELLVDMAPVGTAHEVLVEKASKVIEYRRSLLSAAEQRTAAQVEEARAEAAKLLGNRARNAPRLPTTPPAKEPTTLDELMDYGMAGGFIQEE